MKQLDARHLICPLPVLKARKALLAMAAGDELEVLATDANTLKDFPLFCAESGHVLLAHTAEGGFYRFILRRGAV